MIPELRQRFNAELTAARYAAFLAELNSAMRWPVDFRVAETPLFLDEAATRALAAAAADLVAQLDTPAFRAHARTAIPDGLVVPDEDKFPHFLALDFALGRDAAGRIRPQLIELQGFPTVACWQVLLARAYRRHFPAIPADFTPYLGGLDEAGCLAALRRAVLGDCAPEEVVLLEITPDQQKTRVDFACTEQMLGVRPVCVTAVRRRGRRLFYDRDGVETPIRRIFNRVIFDELLRKPELRPGFSFFDAHDAEWAGHPNWYFRISKHTLPFLRGPHVPECRFVSDLGQEIPGDLENHVLKPLYSFAGLGVDLAPTRAKIAALEKPAEWLLQRKVDYAPVLETPDGPAKAEIRLILVGDGRRMPRLVNQLVRLTKGAMHGVDFNRGRTWVGASAGFHPPV